MLAARTSSTIWPAAPRRTFRCGSAPTTPSSDERSPAGVPLESSGLGAVSVEQARRAEGLALRARVHLRGPVVGDVGVPGGLEEALAPIRAADIAKGDRLGADRRGAFLEVPAARLECLPPGVEEDV